MILKTARSSAHGDDPLRWHRRAQLLAFIAMGIGVIAF
jgi:hypothetical protein